MILYLTIDLVGIPDFLAGAMENWGLITFRETTLLVGNHSSPIDKQLVTSVIAHELAHQVPRFTGFLLVLNMFLRNSIEDTCSYRDAYMSKQVPLLMCYILFVHYVFCLSGLETSSPCAGGMIFG